MASVIDFARARSRRSSRPRVPNHSSPDARPHIRCVACGAAHPLVRLPGGEVRCPTAFEDGRLWFCRHRGCRARWLAGDRRKGS